MKICFGCMSSLDDWVQVCPVCGYAQNTPPRQKYDLLPGTVIYGRYVIGKEIGHGGFGISYIGWDRMLNRKVAIKEYFPSDLAVREKGGPDVRCSGPENLKRFEQGRKSFTTEARNLARLGDISGVVKIFDCVDNENGTAYIIMEYLEGMSLRVLLEKKGRLSYEEALQYINGVLLTLKKVHQYDIIHRDISPDNVFILSNGEVKLIDFGSARYAYSEYSQNMSVILKQGYAPCEQYVSNSVQGPWTDLYGVGATFYRMLTGKIPIEASVRAAEDHLERPSRLCRLPRYADDAIMKALQVRSELRYQSADEFMMDLLPPSGMQKGGKGRRERTNDSGNGSGGLKLNPFVGTTEDYWKTYAPGESLEHGEAETQKADPLMPDRVEFPRESERKKKQKKSFPVVPVILAVLLMGGGIFAGVSWYSSYAETKERQQVYALTADEAVESGRVHLWLTSEEEKRKLAIQNCTGKKQFQLMFSRSGTYKDEQKLKDAFTAYAEKIPGEDSFLYFENDRIGFSEDILNGGFSVTVPWDEGETGLFDLVAGSGDTPLYVYKEVAVRNIRGFRLKKDESDRAYVSLRFVNKEDEDTGYNVNADPEATRKKTAQKVSVLSLPDRAAEEAFTIRKGKEAVICGTYKAEDGSEWLLLRQDDLYGFAEADGISFE